jgi:hypothetical protein
VGNDKNVGVKKEKGIRKLTDRISFWKAKSQADEEERHSPKPKPKLKKIKAKTKQPKNKKFQVIEPQRKANEAKKKEARIKVEPQRKANEAKIEAQRKANEAKIEAQRKANETKKKEARIKIEAQRKANEAKIVAQRKAKEAKKKEARIKVEAQRKAKKAKIVAQRKAKEAKKKEARIKVEAQRKAKEEAKKKEEEAKKKEEEAKRTYEDELEEQLSEEEITGFQLEKTDMDKMCNRVCEMIAGYENEGTLQSELWKKLKLSSRDGSRLALKLERMGMITREKILEKQRWTYKLIIKKIPISTKSIEGAPCLTCPVQSKCSIDGEISPKTCQWIEDWVLIELKNK